jgi:hypothetical protein
MRIAPNFIWRSLSGCVAAILLLVMTNATPLRAGQNATTSPNCGASTLVPANCNGATTCMGGGCQNSELQFTYKGVTYGIGSDAYSIVANVGPGCLAGSIEGSKCGLNTQMYCGTVTECLGAGCYGPLAFTATNIYVCIC